jgi:protein-tyrosine phosphatase
MSSRDLVWDGCLNVRDLGGYRTENGRETRFGAIVRADSVRELSREGWETLLAYGIRTVVDLRMQVELDEDPAGELPIEVVHAPVLVENEKVLAEIEAAGASAADEETSTRDVYLVFLERFRPNFARAIVEVARAPEGGVVVHCTSGKDRTGLVTAMLLRLAGVSIDDVAADYALSADRLRSRHELWLSEAETEEERDRIRRIAATPASAMASVLEEVERRYGGVRGYLLRGGATDEDLDQARARLVD